MVLTLFPPTFWGNVTQLYFQGYLVMLSCDRFDVTRLIISTDIYIYISIISTDIYVYICTYWYICVFLYVYISVEEFNFLKKKNWGTMKGLESISDFLNQKATE